MKNGGKNSLKKEYVRIVQEEVLFLRGLNRFMSKTVLLVTEPEKSERMGSLTSALLQLGQPYLQLRTL